MESETFQPSPAQLSRRHSTGAVATRRQQRRPGIATRRSVDIGSIAFPDPLLEEEGSGGSTQHPSLPAAALRRYDWARQPGVRDSGLATSSSISQFNTTIRESPPQRHAFEPLAEDRPSLFRVGLPPPPTVARERPAQIRRVPVSNQRRRVSDRALAFFGYGSGNRHRKELVALVWTLSFAFIQFAVTISLISYSSVHHSPTQPTLSEWTTCDKPLGLWGCFWLVKIVLDCCMTYWGWRRDCKIRQSDEDDSEVHLEEGLPGDRLPAHEYIDRSTFEPYLMILEVFAVAMLLFIIGPLIYLFWNIILVCLGRHPMQLPHYINPEVGKISKTLVNQIPLVLYIPSPPGEEKNGVADSAPDPSVISKPQPAYGSVEHTYPPKSLTQKRRFMFLRRGASKLGGYNDYVTHDEKSARTVTVWEDCWEQGEFPFVRLTENRASCAICLLDFEEPRRRVAREVIKSWAQNNTNREALTPEKTVSEGTDADTNNSSSVSAAQQSGVQEVSVEQNNNNRDSMHSLRLEDAGEGPQPLRLLDCGHVFHKTCVDPWLTDVSGRCPTCQQRVLIHPPQKDRDRVRP
ncbi:hypothetical protein EW145_g4837 [Phellinidium pouzarii]|uniref:RING-type domain-containing protein n=1 Tax=Phellinidium pouzarii TaxID=167371 RepID=A0A4S4L6X3_9AGAM|nr:hypothetical protein EW145_g4837 [Phellinidium pouzarii]